MKARAVMMVTLVWATIVACVGLPSGPSGQFVGRAAEPGSKERLRWHVSVLSEALAPRDHCHPENLDNVADYIRREFELAGATVSEQHFEADGERFRNVIAHFGHEDADLVVIGAHYDAVVGSPGADDNASGVAGLIEIAHLIASLPLPENRAVQLVAYAIEEPPYFGTDAMGSRVHAASLVDAGIYPDLFICLDQIGYYDSTPGTQRYPSDSLAGLAQTTAADFIAVIAPEQAAGVGHALAKSMQRATNLPVKYTSHPDVSDMAVGISDASSYHRYGLPSVLITDTAPFRGEFRHTSADIADNLDFARMRAVVISLASVVLRME